MAEGDMKTMIETFLEFGGVQIEKLNFDHCKEIIHIISADIEKLIVSGGFTYAQTKKRCKIFHRI